MTKTESDLSKNEKARISLAHEIKENMPNLSDSERVAALAIFEAGAFSMGMEFSEYLEKTFPVGVFGNVKEIQSQAQKKGLEINGGVEIQNNPFTQNINALIYASENADFSTWVHELAHIWQAQLTGSLKENAQKAFQVKNENWQESIYTFSDGHTDTSAEAFAYGFEDFLKHKATEMADEDKKAIFEKFANYMAYTYNGINKNIEVSKEIADVYNAFVMLDDNILSQAEKAVRFEKENALDFNLTHITSNKNTYIESNSDSNELLSKLQFQIVGEQSILQMAESEEKERILEDLKAAKLMDEKFKNMDQSSRAYRIKSATGWEKGVDGKWKYETDDSINLIKSGSLIEKILNTSPQMLTELSKKTPLVLSDVLDAPELFNIFPFMKDVSIHFYSDPNAFRAVLTPQGIKLNTQYIKSSDGEKGIKGVLAHEIQHVIQAIEFSQSTGIQGKNIENLYNDMKKAMKALDARQYDYDITSLKNGLDAYMKDSGEIEARNVARRITMTYDQRRHSTLESTEDVKRNVQFQTRKKTQDNDMDKEKKEQLQKIMNALNKIKEQKTQIGNSNYQKIDTDLVVKEQTQEYNSDNLNKSVNEETSLEENELTQAGEALKNIKFTPQNWEKLVHILNEIKEISENEKLRVLDHEEINEKIIQTENKNNEEKSFEQNELKKEPFDFSKIEYGKTILPPFTIMTDGKLKNIDNALVLGYDNSSHTYLLQNGENKITLERKTLNSILENKSCEEINQTQKESGKIENAQGRAIVFADKERGINGTIIPEFSMITSGGFIDFKNCVVTKHSEADNSYTLYNGEQLLVVDKKTFAELTSEERFNKKYDENSTIYDKMLERQYEDYFKVRENTSANFLHNLSVYSRKEANSPCDAINLAGIIVGRMNKTERDKTKIMLQNLCKNGQTINEFIANHYNNSVKQFPLNENYIKKYHSEKELPRIFNDTISDNGVYIDNNPLLLRGEKNYNLKIGDTISNINIYKDKIFGSGKERIHFDELKIVSSSKDKNSITLMDKNKSFFEVPQDSILKEYVVQKTSELLKEVKRQRQSSMEISY